MVDQVAGVQVVMNQVAGVQVVMNQVAGTQLGGGSLLVRFVH